MHDPESTPTPEATMPRSRADLQSTLSAIVDRYGPTLFFEPERLKLYLLQGHPDAGRDVSLLLSALAARVPQQVLAATSDSDLQAMLPRLVGTLANSAAFDRDSATWVVRAWTHALGLPTPGLDGSVVIARSDRHTAVDFAAIVTPATDRKPAEPTPIAAPSPAPEPAPQPVAAPIAVTPEPVPIIAHEEIVEPPVVWSEIASVSTPLPEPEPIESYIEHVAPLEPIAALEPVEPIEPVAAMEPASTIEPVAAVETIEPVVPVEPLAPVAGAAEPGPVEPIAPPPIVMAPPPPKAAPPVPPARKAIVIPAHGAAGPTRRTNRAPPVRVQATQPTRIGDGSARHHRGRAGPGDRRDRVQFEIAAPRACGRVVNRDPASRVGAGGRHADHSRARAHDNPAARIGIDRAGRDTVAGLIGPRALGTATVSAAARECSGRYHRMFRRRRRRCRRPLAPSRSLLPKHRSRLLRALPRPASKIRRSWRKRRDRSAKRPRGRSNARARRAAAWCRCASSRWTRAPRVARRAATK